MPFVVVRVCPATGFPVIVGSVICAGALTRADFEPELNSLRMAAAEGTKTAVDAASMESAARSGRIGRRRVFMQVTSAARLLCSPPYVGD